MAGWMGSIAEVDLSSSKITFHAWNEDEKLRFIGGRGIGAKIVYDNVGPEVDPLSKDNLLVFAVGPLTATAAPTSGRFSVSTKSPLTGTIFDANSGGFFATKFKACGIDVLVIRGAAQNPVIIYMDDKDIQVLDGEKYWGMRVFEATSMLTEKFGKEARVACIGPAGENLVRIAGIMNDYYRAAARGGVGAVMGSKKLKAIVAKGSKTVEIADKENFLFIVRECNRVFGQNPITSKALPRFGTAVLVNLMNELGVLPAKNFQATFMPEARNIAGEEITRRLLVKPKACFGCGISCGRRTRLDSAEGEGPEYETVFSLGSCCLLWDLETIWRANNLCNDLGLDTISTGVTIACAMELSEKGLTPEEVKWGDGDKIMELIEKTAYRKGFGNDLAEGSRRLAEKYGDPDAAMHVKGLELPAYDPRGAKGQGLAYATSNRGGCHLRSYMIGLEILGVPKRIDRFSTVNKAGLVIYQQNLYAAMDTLVACRFTGYGLDEEYYSRMLSAATGVKYTAEDLMLIGERIWNLEKLFNLREGFGRKDDTLPKRLLSEPLAIGPTKGQVVELDQMLDEYYRARGWDDEGRPAKRTLEKLGLDS
ncbi:MAG: aldehyde ferredoxin oxidoreductase family protein [Candidatus Brockarchaeota archaeon]|nr:aldehyde ferredoxin oxidoreductase family protein [Candidatus Brockarchaeota archaeon]